ncbi:MAG: hypothetical protein HY903_06650 [Deltaproteobacteria bacterium]|nr:hypothetical protein [Deltaproteobacteria bacterium]
MTDELTTAESSLREEAAALGVDDILALCYAFQHKPERLRLYLDVLRKKGGERAQFASCLICFDLARQGDPVFQKEFAYLADTMRVLGDKRELVLALVASDRYLNFLWEMCQAQLDEADPRFAVEPAVETIPADDLIVDLLSDADFGDEFGISVDHGALLTQFDEAIEAFLGGEVGMPIYDPEAGFRLRHDRDVVRIERFLQALQSLRDLVPIARGYRALVLLFYGTHIRSRGFFGGINQRKQALLRDGLQEFSTSGRELWGIVGVLSPMHASHEVWEKISDVLLDYTQWCATAPELAAEGTSSYDAVGRMLARQPLVGNRRRTGRE